VSGTSSRVLPETANESLGGPWATSVWVWLLLLIPALVMSGYQDSSVRFPTALIAAAVALVECAVSIIPFVVASIIRRHTRTIPIPLCLVFWASVGIVHGVVAGFLAFALGGVDAHYVARSIFWAAACLIWLPLTTYAIAQFASRRLLLASLAQSTRVEEATRIGSTNEMSELRSLIVAAIRDNIRPVVVEIARSLEAIGPGLDAGRLMALGRRLSDVSHETTRIIETTTGPAVLPAERLTIEPLAPMIAALDFEKARPVLAAFLTAGALLPVAVAFSFGKSSLQALGLGTTAVVLVVTFVVMVAGMGVPRSPKGGRDARIRSALIVYVIAGVLTGAAAFLGPWQPANHQNYVLAALLVLAVPFAAAALSAAVGLRSANLALVGQIAALERDIQQLDMRMNDRRHSVREQLALVTHGPLRGRLAACAMALNFHAAELDSTSADRTEYISTSVLEHLADALHELDALG
jgi:hypothetical protein